MNGHVPVLLEEALERLALRRGGVYLDGTLGRAGHAKQILARGEGTRLVGLDQDPEALEAARRELAPFGERALLFHSDFAELEAALDKAGIPAVDGILLDLGVSSGQLDVAERGFSFMREGPLDMRMDTTAPLTAADIVNGWEEREISRILFTLGEERMARKVAAAIVRERSPSPIETTTRLAGVVAAALGMRRPGGIHPATRTFQALRMTVNHELPSLERALPAGLGRLKPGGRFAVIAFHSLEDRMVKRFFRAQESPCVCPVDFPECRCGRVSSGRVVTRRAVVAGEEEVTLNPRARSARLRVFEKEEAA